MALPRLTLDPAASMRDAGGAAPALTEPQLPSFSAQKFGGPTPVDTTIAAGSATADVVRRNRTSVQTDEHAHLAGVFGPGGSWTGAVVPPRPGTGHSGSARKQNGGPYQPENVAKPNTTDSKPAGRANPDAPCLQRHVGRLGMRFDDPDDTPMCSFLGGGPSYHVSYGALAEDGAGRTTDEAEPEQVWGPSGQELGGDWCRPTPPPGNGAGPIFDGRILPDGGVDGAKQLWPERPDPHEDTMPEKLKSSNPHFNRLRNHEEPGKPALGGEWTGRADRPPGSSGSAVMSIGRSAGVGGRHWEERPLPSKPQQAEWYPGSKRDSVCAWLD